MAQPAQRASAKGQLAMVVFIAWRNVGRNPVRSVLTISALAAGLAMVILYSALMEGMLRQMVMFATDISTGHMQIHRQAYIDDQDLYATIPWAYQSALESEFPAVRFAPRLYASGLASTQNSSTGVSIKAVDVELEQQATRLLNQVESGQVDLTTESINSEGLLVGSVMIGAQLAKNHGIKPGDELILVTQAADGSIGNALYQVAGIFKPLDPAFDRTGVLMSIHAYQKLMYQENGFHELLIIVDHLDELALVQDRIKHYLTGGELYRQFPEIEPLDEWGGPLVVRNWRELSPSVSDMLAMSQSIVWVVGFIIVGLAAFGVLNTMLMAVHERTHEFGIMLAIGMKPRLVVAMVLIESLFLALIASFLGSLVGIAIANHYARYPIDFSSMMPDGFDWGGMVFQPQLAMYLEPQYVLNGSLLLIVICILAAFVPSWKIIKLKPVEAL